MAGRRSEPNLFELQGGGVSITWTPAGISGNPQLTYDDGSSEVSFGADDIRLNRSPLGRLVTVDLEVQPDNFTRSLVLVVPTVKMGDQDTQRVRTIAVVMAVQTPLSPQLLTGQAQSYKVLKLTGIGRFVNFVG